MAAPGARGAQGGTLRGACRMDVQIELLGFEALGPAHFARLRGVRSRCRVTGAPNHDVGSLFGRVPLQKKVLSIVAMHGTVIPTYTSSEVQVTNVEVQEFPHAPVVSVARNPVVSVARNPVVSVARSARLSRSLRQSHSQR